MTQRENQPAAERGRAEALVLANPACLARRGLSLDDLEGLMARAGLRAEARMIASVPPEALRHYNLVVAAGGDGTVHEAVNRVAPLGLPLGVLPLGTCNDFARTLHLPNDLEEAARVIAEDTAIPIDLGMVNGRYFVNAAHLGLGVETAKHLQPQLKTLLGPIAYGIALVAAWWTAKPLEIDVCVEGHCAHYAVTQMLVGNGRYFGGGLLIGRDATLDDGLLDVYLVGPNLGVREALRLAAALRRGAIGEHDGLAHYRTTRLTADLSRPAEVNLDGEVRRLEHRLVFEVHPGALRAFARAAGVTAIWAPEGLAVERS